VTKEQKSAAPTASLPPGTRLVPRKRLTADQQMAVLIAMHVRDRMEDFHHKHLSNAQMKELNPIIRNAIYDALTIFKRWNQGDAHARQMLNWLSLRVPAYWEPPALSAYVKSRGKARRPPSRT
jgi:hypothetical protein